MGNTAEPVEQLCNYLSENGLSQSDNAADACHGDWSKGSPNTHFAQYFTGNSHLAPIATHVKTSDKGCNEWLEEVSDEEYHNIHQ